MLLEGTIECHSSASHMLMFSRAGLPLKQLCRSVAGLHHLAAGPVVLTSLGALIVLR